MTLAPHTAYWLPDHHDFGDGKGASALLTAVSLTAFQRTVANFVHIITDGNPDISVVFAEAEKANQTDGKTVVLGMPSKSTSLDVMVGMALHEGAHCHHTPITGWSRLLEPPTVPGEFEADGVSVFCPSLHAILGRRICPFVQGAYDIVGKRVPGHSAKEDANANVVANGFWLILNLLEDLRIDQLVYQRAPGYRPYYIALYDKYIRSAAHDTALKKSRYNVPTMSNYIWMLMSLPNNNLKPDDLPGFRDIVALVDLPHFDRFFDLPLGPWHEYAKARTWNGVAPLDPRRPAWVQVDPIWTLANQVLEIVLKECAEYSATHTDAAAQAAAAEGRLPETVNRYLKQRVDYQSGHTRKTQVPKPVVRMLRDIAAADLRVREVGGEGQVLPQPIPVVVVNKVTKATMQQTGFPFLERGKDAVKHRWDLRPGVRMGNMLAERLQFRADPSPTQFVHQDHGKIDRRMLHQLGAGEYKVFSRTTVEYFKPVVLYVTLDASGSMRGSKWRRAIHLSVALAVLAEQNPSIDVVVTLRGTGDVGLPSLAVIHNSRKQSFAESRYVFEHSCPSGLTPESLCFEANLDLILEQEGHADIIFLNISDGLPEFIYARNGVSIEYSGDLAVRHTNDMMRRLKEAGVRVLSYFVGENRKGDGGERARAMFGRMYRQDARFINLESVSDIARTLEQLLSDRESMTQVGV